jgi:hypothetical protein
MTNERNLQSLRQELADCDRQEQQKRKLVFSRRWFVQALGGLGLGVLAVESAEADRPCANDTCSATTANLCTLNNFCVGGVQDCNPNTCVATNSCGTQQQTGTNTCGAKGNTCTVENTCIKTNNCKALNQCLGTTGAPNVCSVNNTCATNSCKRSSQNWCQKTNTCTTNLCSFPTSNHCGYPANECTPTSANTCGKGGDCYKH